MRASRDQASLFGYISPVTGEVSSHPPLCACGTCSGPVEVFKSKLAADREGSYAPWARMRLHGPGMVFDWHETRADAEQAIADSAAKLGDQVYRFQVVGFFPAQAASRTEV